MGAIVTIQTKKQSYDDIEIKQTENPMVPTIPVCPECLKELEQFEIQKDEYNMKYDKNVLALNKPDFIHTDIIYDIYKKSVQNRIDKIKSMNSSIFRVTPDDYKYIGREMYNDYIGKHNQTMNVNMDMVMQSNFIMGQKIIYSNTSGLYRANTTQVKYELYILYFIDRIVFFIFVLLDTDYKLYFREYFFELNCNLYTKEIKKKKIKIVVSDTFQKYFMNMKSIKPLEDITEEYYLSTVKNNIESKFKIIDLMDMFINKIENRLLKNPIFEFHFLIEKQINLIRQIV